MRRVLLTLVALSAFAFGSFPLSAEPTYFNGVSGAIEANGYDAPIWRQFSFVEDDQHPLGGIVATYQVLSPELFLTDERKSAIYQFPLCATLDPVFPLLDPIEMPDGLVKQTDSPTRKVIDVVLSTGCSVQPKSVADVQALALAITPREGFWVNAPLVPENLAELPDKVLFNAPPYRPRITGWQEGVEVTFMTYEATWYPEWTGTAFPNEADVFILSAGPLFRPGWTIFNAQPGVPLHDTFQKYSPIWRGNCVVDPDDPKCMLSVNLSDPAFYQCRTVFECLTMTDSQDNQVQLTTPNTFTHINCPIVAVDLNKDDYVSIYEELVFPDLWVEGPVIV